MNRKLKMTVAGSGLTNYQIELEAGIPLTKLSRIIHEATQPTDHEKVSISKVLRVPSEELFPVTLVKTTCQHVDHPTLDSGVHSLPPRGSGRRCMRRTGMLFATG